jgi:4'-phosphopantetheinyl transferase EntD
MSENATNVDRAQFDPRLPEPVELAVVHASEAAQYPLHPAEYDLILERTSPSRRLAFQLGRGAARLALERLGVDNLPVLRGEHRQPIWPEGVVGSITHASEYAIAVVGRKGDTGGIGIDLEVMRSVDGLAEQVAFGEEKEHIKSLSEQARLGALMTLFSAKESIFKAFFPRVGNYFGFEAARVEPPYESQRLAARLVEPLDRIWPSDRSFQIDCSQYGDMVLTALVLPTDP